MLFWKKNVQIFNCNEGARDFINKFQVLHTESVSGIIWQLGGAKAHECALRSRSSTLERRSIKLKVMISYCWAQQPLVKRIYQHISQDLEVWIDLNK
jgi:hypothetical protein